jgi:hypothetical protein
MDRRMIWIENASAAAEVVDGGWCCSECQWGIIVPRLESTLAALAFSRLAQEEFEGHDCATRKSVGTAA